MEFRVGESGGILVLFFLFLRLDVWIDRVFWELQISVVSGFRVHWYRLPIFSEISEHTWGSQCNLHRGRGSSLSPVITQFLS